MSKNDLSSGALRSSRGDSVVFRRHTVLRDEYLSDSASALITDYAEIVGSDLKDPFKTTVWINGEMKVPFKIGVHRAVGGDHDFPNPGDLLCASLASCFESTLRLISNKLGVELCETKVSASALVDVRGTLMIDKSVPVGFQSMHIEASITTKNGNEKLLNTLIVGVKHSCIIYQTIKHSIPITIQSNIKIKD